MSMTLKGEKPEFMPSTNDVAKYHSLGVYLQIFYWKTLMEKYIDPTLWGWGINNGALEPTMTKVIS